MHLKFAAPLMRRILPALVGLLLCLPAPALLAQPRSIELDDGMAIVLQHRAYRSKLPALVMLPYTGGESKDIYLAYRKALWRYSRNHPLVVLLPDGGETERDDYEDHEEWMETVADWEELTTAVIQQASQRGLIDPKRVYLAGHSMGGDLSWALLLRHPQRYAGALINGSRCSYLWGRYPKKLHFPPVFLSMGNHDAASRQRGMQRAFRLLQLHGASATYRHFTGGHERAPNGLFLQGLEFLRNPAPKAQASKAKTPPAPP